MLYRILGKAYPWASPDAIGKLTLIQLREYLKSEEGQPENTDEDKEKAALGFANALKEMQKIGLKPPVKQEKQ